jgi:hypothetical protein
VSPGAQQSRVEIHQSLALAHGNIFDRMVHVLANGREGEMCCVFLCVCVLPIGIILVVLGAMEGDASYELSGEVQTAFYCIGGILICCALATNTALVFLPKDDNGGSKDPPVLLFEQSSPSALDSLRAETVGTQTSNNVEAMRAPPGRA